MGVCFHRALLLGNMERHSYLRAFERRKKNCFYRIFNGVFKLYAKMPCKRVSFSIGALLGVNLVGLYERKEKLYLGSFLGPRGH
jgi:hypothetical protein